MKVVEVCCYLVEATVDIGLCLCASKEVHTQSKAFKAHGNVAGR